VLALLWVKVAAAGPMTPAEVSEKIPEPEVVIAVAPVSEPRD